MARSRHALVRWFALCAMLALASSAQAVVFSAEVGEFSLSLLVCEPPLDAETNGTGAAASVVLPPPAVPSGSGSARSTAAGGLVTGALDIAIDGSAVANTVMTGCFDASMEIDDVFISGPGAEVTTSVAIDVAGLVSIADVAPGRSFDATVTLRGTAPGGGTVSAFRTTGSVTGSLSTTLVTAPITVSTSQPLTVIVTLHGQGALQTNFCCSSDLFADFDAHFTVGGAVFDLPAGFTADSLAGQIADNVWQGTPLLDCGDGIDNDGDGLVDFVGGDPGCDDELDASERGAALPCDDGVDNDGDDRSDFDPATFASPGDQNGPPAGLGDPGCGNPSWVREDPQCQDGAHNDADGRMDYDAGLSANGSADPAGPDPQCVGNPSRNREAASRCGLGFELALVLPVLAWLRRMRRR